MKICAAPFLNTRPLLCGLAETPGVELQLCSPAQGARRLAERLCDVALLPLAAVARQGDLVAAPGVCIGARGAVGSVLLVADAPVEQLETIALDASSRSSVVLLRLLVAERGLSPRYQARPSQELAAAVGGRRGALIIGDAALQAVAARRFSHLYDLAALWRASSGRPFVFAVWAGRDGALTAELAALLRRCRDRGQASLEALAADGPRHGVDPPRALAYLRDQLCFALDDALLDGAGEYLRRAAAAGLLPAARLRLVGDPPADIDVDARLAAAATGVRLSAGELLVVHERADLMALGAAADRRRRALHPGLRVSYIVDRNINYTNVCTTACRFCAFYRNVGDSAEGYVLERAQLADKIDQTVAAGGRQILLQGGLNPALRLPWYEELFAWIKARWPIRLHALSPEEILHLCRLESLPLEVVLARLIAAGLDSLPGGGAEILVERVRRRIARKKCSGAEWLEVMRVAHRLGLRSSATMMFAIGERVDERIEHLLQIRDLQDETGGFTSFICWPFQPGNTRLPGADASAHAYLRTLALARLGLDNVAHLSASWPTMGPAVGQAALHFGADDFGSVMFEENVVASAGTVFQMDAAQIERHVRAAGFTPRRRDARYQDEVGG